jgi:hypothetical protein
VCEGGRAEKPRSRVGVGTGQSRPAVGRPKGLALTARGVTASTMFWEARQGFLSAYGCAGWARFSWRAGAVAGFSYAAVLRRHTGARVSVIPSPRLGGMKLFGAAVVGAIRRLDRRVGS